MMASFSVGVTLAGLVAWVSKLLQEGIQAFFSRLVVVFLKKLNKPEIFQNINCQLVKLTTIWNPIVTFSNFLLQKMEIFLSKIQ